MPDEQRVLTTADGRSLEVLTAGPPDGLPLLFHNGTPGGLVAFPPMTAAAAERGLRTVMYARPGYGQSTEQPGRGVADTVADAASVLDDLGADQFVTIGWSGGGPHALACAALLPGRCLAATSLAGVAPARAAGLDWVAGMGPENIEEFGAAEQGAAALTAYLAPEADGLRQVTGEQVADELGGLVSAVDRDVVTAEFALTCGAGRGPSAAWRRIYPCAGTRHGRAGRPRTACRRPGTGSWAAACWRARLSPLSTGCPAATAATCARRALAR